MRELPLKEKLVRRFYEFRYSEDSGDFIFIYRRDPYVYGPDVLCVFDTVSENFLFEGQRYTVDQFSRVLDLLAFI